MMFHDSFLISAVIVLAIGVAASIVARESGRWVAGILTIYAVLTFLQLFPPMQFFHGIGIAMVVIACYTLSARPRTTTALILLLTAGTIGWRATILSQRASAVRELMQKYPIESLAERLDYERRTDSQPADLNQGNAGFKSESTSSGPGSEHASQEAHVSLEEWEREFRSVDVWTRRRALPALRRAHEKVVNEFTEEEGFGVVRSPDLPARKEYIDIPEPPVIPLPSPSPQLSAELAESDVDEDLGLESATAATAGAALEAAHRRSVVDFVNPLGFGDVEHSGTGKERRPDLDRVVGFQSHAFRQMPDVNSFLPNPTRQWRIVELQLVSIVKHNPPVAYRSKNLPRMDELREAATRPLDAFESSALARLRTGEELIVGETPRAIRMMGAIRALEICADCHRLNRGDLLGAFSYRLERIRQSEEKPTVPQRPPFIRRPT